MMFNDKLKQYLLGNLDEKETEQIDLKIISDESFEEKLLIVEHSLIEDFIEQNLSAEEKNLFYRNFLISPEREKMVEQIAALKRVAKRKVSEEAKSESDDASEDGFFQNLFRALTLQPAKAVFGVLIIGAFIGAIGFILLSSDSEIGSDPLEVKFAKLNKGDFSDLEKFKNYEKLELLPGVSRSAEKSKVLDKNNLTDQILVRLALPPKMKTDKVYQVQFLNNEVLRFTQKGIPPVKIPNGEELRFIVPSEVLDAGEYLIKVKNDETPEIIYSFFVE